MAGLEDGVCTEIVLRRIDEVAGCRIGQGGQDRIIEPDSAAIAHVNDRIIVTQQYDASIDYANSVPRQHPVAGARIDAPFEALAVKASFGYGVEHASSQRAFAAVQ